MTIIIDEEFNRINEFLVNNFDKNWLAIIKPINYIFLIGIDEDKLIEKFKDILQYRL